jgi:hypothetical protein
MLLKESVSKTHLKKHSKAFRGHSDTSPSWTLRDTRRASLTWPKAKGRLQSILPKTMIYQLLIVLFAWPIWAMQCRSLPPENVKTFFSSSRMPDVPIQVLKNSSAATGLIVTVQRREIDMDTHAANPKLVWPLLDEISSIAYSVIMPDVLVGALDTFTLFESSTILVTLTTSSVRTRYVTRI